MDGSSSNWSSTFLGAGHSCFSTSARGERHCWGRGEQSSIIRDGLSWWCWAHFQRSQIRGPQAGSNSRSRCDAAVLIWQSRLRLGPGSLRWLELCVQLILLDWGICDMYAAVGKVYVHFTWPYLLRPAPLGLHRWERSCQEPDPLCPADLRILPCLQCWLRHFSGEHCTPVAWAANVLWNCPLAFPSSFWDLDTG